MLQKRTPKPITPEEFVRTKTLWQGAKSQVWSFYCPQCRASRKLPYRSQPGGWRHIAKVSLAAAFFTLVLWPIFGLKGMVSFVPFWAIFEVVYRMKLRVQVGCPYCGFDPYLYMNDVGKARTRMEDHWRQVFTEKGIPYPPPKTAASQEAQASSGASGDVRA